MEERIIIIWLSPTGEQRGVFEIPYGDRGEVGKIFNKLLAVMMEEKGPKDCA